jgi:hypothetical protein
VELNATQCRKVKCQDFLSARDLGDLGIDKTSRFYCEFYMMKVTGATEPVKCYYIK